MTLNKSILLSFVHIKFLNRWVVFIIDILLSVISVFVSVRLVKYTVKTISIDISDGLLLFYAVIAGCLSILLLKTYKGIIRHSAFSEIFRMAVASVLKVGILAFILVLGRYYVYPLVLLVCFDSIFTFFLLAFFRASLIVIYYWLLQLFSDRKENILIYYDPTTSTDLMPVQFSESNRYRVVGYISHGAKKQLRIEGVPVYNFKDESDIIQLKKLEIKSILFPNAEAARIEQERLLRYCQEVGISTLLFPPIREWEDPNLHRIKHLSPVRIEDLLGRSEIKINLEEIHKFLKGKIVLVTGAAGSIGSELCRQLCTCKLKQLILFDNAETPMHNIRLELEELFPDINVKPVLADVRMKERVTHVFSKYHPDLVFHAAAYKHVPLMEENPCEAVNTNAQGTSIVANAAVHYGVEKFIMISTDKVVNPTNVMGASKRLAEIYVQSLGEAIEKGFVSGKTKFVTTRFGNVLGSNGSVIPRFRKQIDMGGPLTVTHPEIIRYFMTIPEACRLVLEASFLGGGNDIFVFDMGKPVKIDTLARRMIELSGLVPDKDIKILYTGLRPGEKLYEELLAKKENVLPTANSQIYRAKVRQYEYVEVCKVFEYLFEQTLLLNKMEVVRVMKRLIPEYKSKNSIFEKLDQSSEQTTDSVQNNFKNPKL